MRVSFATWRRATGAVLSCRHAGPAGLGRHIPRRESGRAGRRRCRRRDDQGSDRAGRDGLQLEHRARARRAPGVAAHLASPTCASLDIAATVNPATVHFRSLSEPSRLGILEQNYQFDLLDPQRLLKKYVGRDVKLLRTRMENGTSRQEEVTARLLAFNDAPVWQIGNEIVTGLARRAVPLSRRSPRTCTAGRRWCGSWTTAGSGSTASRRRTWRRT